MRRAAVAFAVTFGVGLLGVAVAGLVEKRSEAFTINVGQVFPMAPLDEGEELCQQPIDVPAGFNAVQLGVGTFERPGPPFRIEVRKLGGRTLGKGRVAGGYGDNEQHVVDVGEVDEGEQVAVCVVNEGPRPLAVYGAQDISARTSQAFKGQEPLAQDASFLFLRDDETSVLALLPQMVERASVFHGAWVHPWLLWVLLAGAVIGVPLLLLVALGTSRGSARPGRAARGRGATRPRSRPSASGSPPSPG